MIFFFPSKYLKKEKTAPAGKNVRIGEPRNEVGGRSGVPAAVWLWVRDY